MTANPFVDSAAKGECSITHYTCRQRCIRAHLRPLRWTSAEPDSTCCRILLGPLSGRTATPVSAVCGERRGETPSLDDARTFTTLFEDCLCKRPLLKRRFHTSDGGVWPVFGFVVLHPARIMCRSPVRFLSARSLMGCFRSGCEVAVLLPAATEAYAANDSSRAKASSVLIIFLHDKTKTPITSGTVMRTDTVRSHPR